MMSSSQMTTDVIEYPTLTLLVIVKSSAGPPVTKLSPWLAWKFFVRTFLMAPKIFPFANLQKLENGDIGVDLEEGDKTETQEPDDAPEQEPTETPEPSEKTAADDVDINVNVTASNWSDLISGIGPKLGFPWFS